VDGGAERDPINLLGWKLIFFAMASRIMDVVHAVDPNPKDIQVDDMTGSRSIHVACEFGFSDGVTYIYAKCQFQQLN
jgi:hypothetical protein